MTIETLRDLYVNEIRDLYDAETQITKALPKMIDKVSSEELKSALHEHLQVTNGQVGRLEQIFEMLGENAKARKCQGIRGIIDEGKDTMNDLEAGSIMDAGIIAAAQRVEHYEIAAYGTVCAYAKELGLEDQQNLLHETLEEEKEADDKLTQIAESVVNIEAVRRAG